MAEELTEEKKREEESKFNVAELILYHVNQLQIISTDYYLKGNIEKWYFTYKAIRFRIMGKLNKIKRASLDKKEKAIQKVINVPRLAVPLIENYIAEIQDYIEDANMGIVSKGDETTFT